jgi:hypothetical protein
MRKIFRAENPGMSFGKLTKFTSAMYKSLTPEVKSRWEEAAMQDKARYVNEMSTYVPPSSMIINQEGTSSKVEYNCSKKKNYPRRDSFASPISRRRSERVNILRQEIKVLIGITEMKTDKVERAIVELKLDSLENLLNDDDTPAVYWAIAGTLNFYSIVFRFSCQLTFIAQEKSCSNLMAPYHVRSSNGWLAMRLLAHLPSRTTLLTKSARLLYVIVGGKEHWNAIPTKVYSIA